MIKIIKRHVSNGRKHLTIQDQVDEHTYRPFVIEEYESMEKLEEDLRLLRATEGVIKYSDDSQFLEDLSRELQTQDNRMTAHPIYIVQQKERIWGLADGYADFYRYVDENGDRDTTYDEGEIMELGLDPDDPDGFERIGCRDQYVYVCAHLTERAAQLYINQNSHNLHSPRIYVHSQYRCYEWIKAIDLLSRTSERCSSEPQRATPSGAGTITGKKH